MQRQVYVRLEYRNNIGEPVKTLERLTIFEDKDDQDYLTEVLEDWLVQTAKSMSVIMSTTKAQLKKLRLDANRRLVAD